MRKFIIPAGILLLSLLLGTLFGCGGDDPAQPKDEACSITLTGPDTAVDYLTGDPCNVRWNKEGTATAVKIELLQGGATVGDIAAMTDNDGFFPWSAGVMGGAGGPGFAIRVTALGATDCGATTGLFTIVNTANCGIEVTGGIHEGSTYHDGTAVDLTWTSNNTTGTVGLELWHGHLLPYFVGQIATGTADDGTYSWVVDSFNDTAHRTVNDPTVYWIKVSDMSVGNCFGMSGDFTLIDETLCEITVLTNPSGASHDKGDPISIEFSIDEGSGAGTVKIRLYAGSLFVPGGYIGDGVSLTPGTMVWTVDNYGYTQGGDHFNIRVFDSEDDYCWGKSENFSINE